MTAVPAKTVRLLSILFFVLLAAAVVTGFFYVRSLPESSPAFSEIPASAPGAEPLCADLRVDGISLAGLTRAEALAALEPAKEAFLSRAQFVLDTGSGTRTVTYADMRFAFDTHALVEAALQGETGQRQLSCRIDLSPLWSRLEQLRAEVDTPPRDASVQMRAFGEERFVFTEGQSGRRLDTAALQQQLQSMADAHSFGVVPMPIQYEEPAVTAEGLKQALCKRSEATTSFKKSPYNRAERVFNIKKAVSLINGTVLQPGEVFSANTVLGDRTYELGWQSAPAYVNGGTEDQAGGGVCQVSTTVYCAAVKADLEIVYRQNHSSTVGYVTRGLDATINTGTIDFQFRNSTASPLYVFAYVTDAADGPVPEGRSDQSVYVEIYGESLPEEYDEIRLTSEKVQTLRPSGKQTVTVDPTAPPGTVTTVVERRNGSVYQSYKNYYKNDQLVKTEPLDKSTYRAYAGKLIVSSDYYK